MLTLLLVLGIALAVGLVLAVLAMALTVGLLLAAMLAAIGLVVWLALAVLGAAASALTRQPSPPAH